MTNDMMLWSTLHEHLPRGKWIAITDIFLIIQQRTLFDAEDLKCVNSRSKAPWWKSNVRRILHNKLKEGTLCSRKTH